VTKSRCNAYARTVLKAHPVKRSNAVSSSVGHSLSSVEVTVVVQPAGSAILPRVSAHVLKASMAWNVSSSSALDSKVDSNVVAMVPAMLSPGLAPAKLQWRMVRK